MRGIGVGAATYNAWRFAANAPLGSPVSTPGTLQLTGDANNYDTCPNTLIFDYLRQTDDPAAARHTEASVDNFIALVPCKQDLSQDGGPTVIKTRLVRYDENERSGSGQICLNCFFADSAANVPAFPNVNTPGGMFRAEPFSEVGGPCELPSPQLDTYPVVGVIVKHFDGYFRADNRGNPHRQRRLGGVSGRARLQGNAGRDLGCILSPYRCQTLNHLGIATYNKEVRV